MLQPEPRYTAAFEVREVTATASTTSAYGLGWGADVGISKRLRVAGELTCLLVSPAWQCCLFCVVLARCSEWPPHCASATRVCAPKPASL